MSLWSLQDGIFIEPKDVRYLPNGQTVKRPGDNHYPQFDDHSGANYLERDMQLLHLVSDSYKWPFKVAKNYNWSFCHK